MKRTVGSETVLRKGWRKCFEDDGRSGDTAKGDWRWTVNEGDKTKEMAIGQQTMDDGTWTMVDGWCNGWWTIV